MFLRRRILQEANDISNLMYMLTCKLKRATFFAMIFYITLSCKVLNII